MHSRIDACIEPLARVEPRRREFEDATRRLPSVRRRQNNLIQCSPAGFDLRLTMASPRVLMRSHAVLSARRASPASMRFVSTTQPRTSAADGAKETPRRKPLTKEQQDFLSSAVRLTSLVATDPIASPAFQFAPTAFH